MTKTIYTQNRELSWLRFNERVLEEAIEKDVPDFERLKFISIFTSNLDEFFMIRVGSLFDQTFLSKPSIDNKTGMTAEEQLEAIFAAVAPLYEKRDEIYRAVMKKMEEWDIEAVSEEQLTKSEKHYLEDYFDTRVYPVLSPQIINGYHPFPHLINKGLYIALQLKVKEKKIFGIIPVPPSLSRIIKLPGAGCRFVLLEELILRHAEAMFDNCKVEEKSIISVTRNADISVSDIDDEDEDYRHQMKKVLKKRARLSPVRLEYYQRLDANLEEFFLQKLKLKKNQVFGSKAPLEMSYVFGLAGKIPEKDMRTISYTPFEPHVGVTLGKGEKLLEKASKKDLFLSYPYDSMNPFLKMLREAAEDPNVISIKITIYRLASKATMIDSLRLAAENGKDVTVLMELRARFDEANNINWSEALEEAGCTVIYGIENYKVHSKLCLITRMENGQLQRITQVGTGNYNENTAKLYTDFSLITGNEAIGKDAADYFKNMAIANLDGHYRKLLVAPNSMKSIILALIHEETEKVRKGEKGEILFKVNSLTDKDVIIALKDASQAGVRIRMIVRGICCLLPGVEGYTENIEVTSVVGRFLEHSRVFCFGAEDAMQMYISSADLMTRNLNKRVEVACPVLDINIQREILDILDLMLADNVKARMIRPDGTYAKKPQDGEKIDAQQKLIERAQLPVPEYPAKQAPQKAQEPSSSPSGFSSWLKKILKLK